MHIPRNRLERFVADKIGQCTASQRERTERGSTYNNYFYFGAASQDDAASYGKTFAYIDDLESLLYSPVELKFHIGNPELPNALEIAKGQAAATRLRSYIKHDEIDTKFSGVVSASLVKGKAFMKARWHRGPCGDIVQPEAMGVYMESHNCLDENMEAFTHSMYITPHQFLRLIKNESQARKDELIRKAKSYQKDGRSGLIDASHAAKQVVVGGMYPFQAADSQAQSTTRGIVDWMGGPSPTISPEVMVSLLRLDEAWIWDDERQDWATFQMVGNDMLIMGKYQIINAMAYNPVSKVDVPELKGKHPFIEVDPNRIDGYFWGRSEIVNVALLQEAINSRFNGINRLLRREEKPSRKFIGGSGVNQQALARYDKPGGWWTDTNPQAKVETDQVQVGPDLWNSLHEYERMFDEMGGLPPIAKGRGESGVRSQGHADTLVRMFSPRFKDRALIVERNCSSMGQIYLDLARAHDAKTLLAWVSKTYAGLEEKIEQDPFLIAPAPGLVPVIFNMADLDDDMAVSVDSHSSSPAFSAEAKSLAFDLLKVGGMDAVDVIEHTDAPNAEELVAGVQRRGAEKAAQIAKLDEQAQLKALQGGKK